VKLLIIEDDTLIAEELADSLAAMGHTSRHCATGAEGVSAMRQAPYDAIILDRMLPDMTGTGVLEHLRSIGAVPPVLVLSALGSVKDRIEGLNAGADDYLAKPYDINELGARLAALARRSPQAHADGLSCSIGRLRLDAAQHKAAFAEQSVALNRLQVGLLAFLMRHADRLVTRSMLLEGVWDYTFNPSTNLVESNISRLRGRLEEIGCDPIITRRGEGYVLMSDQCR
jgi:two-component system OmpR family response regulator